MPDSNHFRLLEARLRVASLERTEAFYRGILGLEPETDEQGRRALSPPGGPPVLRLIEAPGALPAPPNAPGLFHLAFLVPRRRDLARILRRLVEAGHPPEGASDHGVSEAIYLSDPDGNGLEIYWDRERGRWPSRNGRLHMFTRALDIPGLLSADPEGLAAGLPEGTVLGHVHLRVADLKSAERFFTHELSLDLTVGDYPGALFFGADGYHHHIGANTWNVSGRRDDSGAGLDSVVTAGIGAARTLAGPDGVRFERAP